MQVKRKRIFDTPAAQLIPSLAHLASEYNHNPATSSHNLPPNNIDAPQLRQIMFRKSKVYRRASSSDTSSSNYTYKVRNHIYMEGNVLDCCCAAMGCNIVDVAEEQHRKRIAQQLKEQLLKTRNQQQQDQLRKSMAKQKQPNPNLAQSPVSSKNKNEKEQAQRGYHASYVPNTEPLAPRKNLFKPIVTTNRHRSTSLDYKSLHRRNSRYRCRQFQRWMTLETIKEESQTSKLQSVNSQSSANKGVTNKSSIVTITSHNK